MSVNTNKTEKDKALEAAMAQIQKQFGKGAIMKLGDESAQMNIDAIWISRPASAAYRKAGSWRSTDRNPPVRQR